MCLVFGGCKSDIVNGHKTLNLTDSNHYITFVVTTAKKTYDDGFPCFDIGLLKRVTKKDSKESVYILLRIITSSIIPKEGSVLTKKRIYRSTVESIKFPSHLDYYIIYFSDLLIFW